MQRPTPHWMREPRLSARIRSTMRWAAFVVMAFVQGALGQLADPAAVPAPGAQVRRSGPDRVNWWNDRVFYQIFPRSFADSATGPLAGDGIGDLQGIIEHLDYLNDGNPETTTDLGIGGIWLTPFYPSPSYHGYDITDYYEVHPQLGTIDLFKKLVSECHTRGINVIIDLVMNHCSNRHDWFTKAAEPGSRTRDWFIWSDTDPGWKGPWNQRVWHRLPPGPTANDRYYYGLFSGTMPDLNFRNAGATEAMRDVTRTWIGTFGADGLRLDAIRHLIEEGQVQQNTTATHAWLKDWFLDLKGVSIDAMSIGEVWADSAQASSYVGDQMDMAFEFALADAMIASAKSGKKDEFVAAQKTVLALYPPNQYGRFLSNHDQTRVMTQLKGDAGAMRAAAALLLLGPGVPFIYYGEEIGMTGDKPDEQLRTPMQWTSGAHAGFSTAQPWAPLNPGFETLNTESQSAAPDSLLNLYRRLIHLRNADAALATGGTWMVETDQPGVVAFLRHRAAKFGPKMAESRPRLDSVLVLVNLGESEVRQCRLSLAEGPLRGALAGKDALGTSSLSDFATSDKGAFTGVSVGPLPPHGASAFALTPK